MHGGGNRIYGHYIFIHNGQFTQCEVLENFQGLCGPRTRTRTCKLVLEEKDFPIGLYNTVRVQCPTATYTTGLMYMKYCIG